MPKKDVGESASEIKGRGKLTDKQKRFVEEYLKDLNATQAAIRSGYSEKTAEQISYQLLQKTSVQEAIEQAQNARSNRLQLSQDQVLRDLQEVRDICMGRKSVVMTETVKNNQNGTISAVDNPIFVFEPTAANKALELLGKHLGMFTQKMDVTSSDGSLSSPTIIELIAPQFENQDEQSSSSNST